MLKLLLVLVPTVILFGCRTSVPGIAGVDSVADRVTHTTQRPTFNDPFGQIQGNEQQQPQTAQPVAMATDSPVQKAAFVATPQPVPASETNALPERNPFAELPAVQQGQPIPTDAPAVDQPDSSDTSWYFQHEEGSTDVSDLSETLPTGDDSPGWKRSRNALSAN